MKLSLGWNEFWCGCFPGYRCARCVSKEKSPSRPPSFSVADSQVPIELNRPIERVRKQR